MTTLAWRAVLALSLTLLAGPVGAAEKVLALDAATQRRLGVTTAPLAAARRSTTISGFARTVDPVPLATLDADIATALAAASASQAEATRTRTLNAADQTVSRQVADTARAQSQGDSAKLALLRRRLALEWGSGIDALSDARRSQLVTEIAAGRAALVRIDAAGGLIGRRGIVAIDLGPAGVAHASIIGPTRVGDPRLQSSGALALVRGPLALEFGIGAVAPATLAIGAEASGVIIPRSALLRTAGQTYAYVRRDAGSFERRAVVGPSSDPGGLFAPVGFRPGEQVVTAGASQLFAAETPAPKAQ